MADALHPSVVQPGARIQAIIFDADGVVVDSERIWDAAQTEFSRMLGIPYEREKLKPLMAGRSQAEAVEILKAEYGVTGDTLALATERMDLVRREFEKGVGFVPGFREFFERIQPHYSTCVATSMPELLLAVVDERLELTRLFGGRIFSLISVGFRSKPNPDIFLHASRELGVEPANCLVIEDAPNGIEAARRAGMKCVAISTTFGRSLLGHADVVVDTFREINLDRL